MKNGTPRIVHASIAATTTLLAGVSAANAGVPVENENSVIVLIDRVTDDFTPDAAFFGIVEVWVPYEVGVVGVSVTTPDGTTTVLDAGEESIWDTEFEFADFAAVKTMLDGTWIINVDAEGDSISHFTLDLDPVVEKSLMGSPVMINPLSGETGVLEDTTFAWTSPAGAENTDALFVDVESYDETVAHEANSLDGGVAVTDTDWTPPGLLADGWYEFAVMYLQFDSGALMTPLTVDEGGIVWGFSPFAPAEYPALTPLLAFSGETIIGFHVGEPCPVDLDGSGDVGFSDLLAVLSQWGPCLDCPADLDGSGDVGFSDLLAILAAWGPCS